MITLLEEFVFSLSKTERRKLRPLHFRGSKRRIFLKILSCKTGSGIDSEKMIRICKLTRKRYNQMSAEMLASCYHDVAALGGIELLQYLGNRQLYRHFYKEMQRLEHSLIKTGTRKELEEFYFKVLLMSEFFLIPPHLGGKLRGEIKKYLHRYTEVKAKHPCDACLTRAAEIDEEINENFMRDFSLQKLRKSTDELEGILSCLKEHDHVLARIKVGYMLAMTYFGNFMQDKKPGPYIAFICKTVDEHPEVFGSVGELIKLGATSYLPPETSDIPSYKQYLRNPSPTGEGSSLLFIERFLPLVDRAGEHAWAKKFISEHFPNNIDQIRKDIALHWWRLLLVHHAYCGELVEARYCLTKALTANRGKNRNIEVEINLRSYDAFITVMIDGPDLAMDHVKKHIRFANRHGYNKGEGFMMLFLRAVFELVSYPDFDKPHALKVRQKYLADLGGEGRLSPLFEQIYLKYFS